MYRIRIISEVPGETPEGMVKLKVELAKLTVETDVSSATLEEKESPLPLTVMLPNPVRAVVIPLPVSEKPVRVKGGAEYPETSA